MKLEVYNTEKPVVEEPIRLRLVQYGKSISLEAVDENGDRVTAGFLMTFLGNGYIRMEESINPDIGFNLDSSGRLITR